ncbi:MAG TPA: hypothetical protein EYH54_01125 [Nautiliaceae bacterium]|nr:hypothetical protein [Nautiliaceae bacterium]
MKKLFSLIFFFVFLFSSTIQIIEEIKEIEQFKPKFKNVQNFDIFSFEEDKKKIVDKKISFIPKKSPVLQIYAIFQNKVNINGRWFKVGDKIYGYKIVKISKKFVLLKKGNIKTYLKILSTNKIKIN